MGDGTQEQQSGRALSKQARLMESGQCGGWACRHRQERARARLGAGHIIIEPGASTAWAECGHGLGPTREPMKPSVRRLDQV